VATAALVGDLPAIVPIGRVSPTLGESLRTCALQVAFRLDHRFDSYRRPSTPAALGIASHELLEDAGAGAFSGLAGDALRDALERRWDELVAFRAEKLREAWSLGEVPEPLRWPGYELTRTRLIASLAQQVERVSHADHGPSGGKVETELWLEDEAGVIGGRVDRIERGLGGVRIIDLKSGWTVGAEVTEPQRRQLLIYAYLWHANHGTWPTEAAIQQPDGTRRAVAVCHEDATAEAESLREAREAYNDRARRGANAEDLAQPSSESCQRCPFKASCPYFFASAKPEWDWYRPSVLIRLSQADHDEAVTLIRGNVLASTSMRTPPPGAASLVVAPAECQPDTDSLLALADAYHPGAQR
jgi:RecB family exonuclease